MIPMKNSAGFKPLPMGSYAGLTLLRWGGALILSTLTFTLSVQAQSPAPAIPPIQATPPTTAVPIGETLDEARAAVKAAPASAIDSALFLQLLVSEMALQEGQNETGFALMLDAARKTGNPQLFERATEMALQARSGDAALQAAQAWKQNQPTSREANRTLLQILISLNRIADSGEPLRFELQQAPDIERAAVLAAIPRAYARASDKKLASETVEKAVANYLVQPAYASAAWTTVGRMRLAANDATGALEAAQRGQAANLSNPNFQTEGPVLVALELIDPKLPGAEALVRSYFEKNPQALPDIRMGYVRALIDAERYMEAATQLQAITQQNPEYAESWLVLGSLQLQNGQLNAAQPSLERYLQLVGQQPVTEAGKRGLAQAYLALAQVAEKRKDFPAAEAWLAKIDNPAELAQIQTRRAFILARQGKLDEARQLIRQLPERSLADVQLKRATEVSLLRELKQYQAASDLLTTALAKMPDDTDLLYEQAMVLEKLGKFAEMERLIRRIMTLKPDYQHAYNALGYSLAERNVRLPEARELIKKALEFAPSDPFIQDSLGWVEFRMGNKTEALRILEAAYKQRPDSEIGAHLGEVLWSLGQRERAVVIWKESRLLNADNATLLETVKRLGVKLP